jgi:hypothetical protein
MSTARDRLGNQVMEVKQDLQKMRGAAQDAVQEKLDQFREHVSEQGRDNGKSLSKGTP